MSFTQTLTRCSSQPSFKLSETCMNSKIFLSKSSPHKVPSAIFFYESHARAHSNETLHTRATRRTTRVHTFHWTYRGGRWFKSNTRGIFAMVGNSAHFLFHNGFYFFFMCFRNPGLGMIHFIGGLGPLFQKTLLTRLKMINSENSIVKPGLLSWINSNINCPCTFENKKLVSCICCTWTTVKTFPNILCTMIML